MTVYSDLKTLVVDDDEIDREIICRILQNQLPCIKITEASSYSEACRLIDKEEHFDCVFIDYRLPDSDGVELVKRIRRESRGHFAVIIVITGMNGEETAVNAMKAGAHDFLMKDRLCDTSLMRAFENAIEKARLAQDLYVQQEVQKNFAALAAHELKSPLNVVSGFLQMISDELSMRDAHIKDYVETAINSTEHMTNLVSSLLAYAKSGEAIEEMQQVDLGELVEAATGFLQEEIVAAEAELLYDDLPTVKARPEELLQLFRNLISNAIRYKSDEPPKIEITAGKYGDGWHIAVADNGIGVPPEMRTRIFEPLQRVDKSKTSVGHGLGLAICAKIARSHEGKIWWEPNEPTGSRFVFSLAA